MFSQLHASIAEEFRLNFKEDYDRMRWKHREIYYDQTTESLSGSSDTRPEAVIVQ